MFAAMPSASSAMYMQSQFGYLCLCSLLPIAVVATLLDTVDAGCSSREKRSPAGIKSESLNSFVPGTYSRKVFIGGLPPDLDAGTCTVCPCMYLCVCVACVYELCAASLHVAKSALAVLTLPTSILLHCMQTDDIKRHFVSFGAVLVDWPYRAKSRALFPPRGDWMSLHLPT